jgi:signal recognition particle subunit SRP54
MVAADLQRPAAIAQLEQLGRQIGVPVYARRDGRDPVAVVREGIDAGRRQGCDVVLLDTAGRLHVDEEMMDELAAVRREAKPHDVLLVLDAMTGQEAVAVAQAFQDRVSFDGIVLTKLDGDARGGAALSVKAMTGRPIKFASVGEKLDQLELFHPDRMASRILGMGDVLSLIERAQQAVERDEQALMEERLLKGQFSFEDFLKAYRMIRRMGPLRGVLKMIPGVGREIDDADVDERQLARVEAIVLSMTPQERRAPQIIDGKRRRRIAAGSGTTVQQVNQVLDMRRQMERMLKQMGKGGLPGMPSLPGPSRKAKRGKRKARSRH